MFCTAAATPWLPLPPTPLPALSTGHCTDWPAPTLVFQSALKADRALVKISVVPEPSERCTTVMLGGGQFLGDIGVERDDGRVIPLGDLAVVDAHQDVPARG